MDLNQRAISIEQIKRARAERPKTRERDLAQELGISEAELVAAYCGEGVTRIEPRVSDMLLRMEGLGEVMALTRNESAVHEKIGVYEKVTPGEGSALVLGEQIDLRVFPRNWAHAFAVEKPDGDAVRHSLQFFDAAGEAVHKIHLRPASDHQAYRALVDDFASNDQSPGIEVRSSKEAGPEPAPEPDATELRTRWAAMRDVHEFHAVLRSLKLTRQQALRSVGKDFAWALDGGSVEAMLNSAAAASMPIMCFVGNRGCIQIHSGPVANIRPMGPWLNIMDETFHLHLRLDHIKETWLVRKPVEAGHVTSIEAFDADGSLIIQFFGQRHEGEAERGDWRSLAESLPARRASAA